MAIVLIVYELHTLPLTRDFITQVGHALAQQAFTYIGMELDEVSLQGMCSPDVTSPQTEDKVGAQFAQDCMENIVSFIQSYSSILISKGKQPIFSPIDPVQKYEWRAPDMQQYVGRYCTKIAAHREQEMVRCIESLRTRADRDNKNVLVILGRNHNGLQHQLINYAKQKGDLTLLQNYKFIVLDGYNQQLEGIPNHVWGNTEIAPYPQGFCKIDVESRDVLGQLDKQMRLPAPILSNDMIQNISALAQKNTPAAICYTQDLTLLISMFQQIDSQAEIKNNIRYAMKHILTQSFIPLRENFSTVTSLDQIECLIQPDLSELGLTNSETDQVISQTQTILQEMNLKNIKLKDSKFNPVSHRSSCAFFTTAILIIVITLVLPPLLSTLSFGHE